VTTEAPYALIETDLRRGRRKRENGGAVGADSLRPQLGRAVKAACSFDGKLPFLRGYHLDFLIRP